MKLVVENDPNEIQRIYRLRQIERSLVDLAANLLRVCRGAGKPRELGLNCAAVIEAYEDFREDVGRYPNADEVACALSFSLNDERSEQDDLLGEKLYALDDIVRGSLQLIASQYLNQRPQRIAGERQINEGVRGLESYRQKQQEKINEIMRDERKGSKNQNRRKPKEWP
ncbi:hypothetical protein IWQ49_003938 [Labrenzia sp. EL_126]|nr:hypothetical protein [Labrenzia sp. EL_126]